MCSGCLHLREVFGVVFLVVFKVLLDLSNFSHDGVPMCIRGKDRTAIVHFHDSNTPRHLFHVAVLLAIFVLLLYHVAAFNVELQIGRRTKAVASTRADGSARCCCTIARSAVGHEREHQPFQSINAVLHIVWRLIGTTGGILLLTLW